MPAANTTLNSSACSCSSSLLRSRPRKPQNHGRTENHEGSKERRFSQVSQNPSCFRVYDEKPSTDRQPRRLEGSEDSFQIYKAFVLSCLSKRSPTNGGNTTKARRERRFFPNSQTLRAFVSTTKSPQPIDKPRRLFTKPSCFRVYQKEALPTDGTPRRLEGTKVFSQISQNPFVFSCLRRKALNGPTKPRRLEGSEDSFQIHKAFELSCLRRKALNGPTNHEGLEGSESSSQIHKPFVSCLRRKTLNGPTTTKARRNEDSFRIHRPSRFRDRHARPWEARPVQRSRC